MSDSFKEFMGGKDIFGFEAEIRPIPKRMIEEKPVKSLELEVLTNYLAKYKLGPKLPYSAFMNEVQWGFGTGSVRVRINQKMKVVVERLNRDFSDNFRWICKKVYQIDRGGASNGKEEALAQEIFDTVQEVDQQELNGPKKDYEDFENLIGKMVETLKKTASPMFVYEGVRKVTDQNYIIRWSLRGHGVEARDHRQVYEAQIQVVYDKEAGLIRVTEYRIEGHTGGKHEWKLSVPDHTLYFFPTQPIKEIIDPIANVYYWY